jgi:hypothetical protein
LGGRRWLDDEIINFMLMGYVENFGDNIGCYSSFFMSKLLGMNEQGRPHPDPNQHVDPWYPTGYFYGEVRRWHNRLQPGLFNLEHLFVPINVGRAHWILLHVRPREKKIELYDSYGVKEENQIYITQFATYLHQLYGVLHEDYDQSYESWEAEWSLSDESANSPSQSDGYNCGVFVILSAYLLSVGHQLRRGSYTQQMIMDNKTRLRIAHLIRCKDNRSEAETISNVRNWLLGAGSHTSQLPAAQGAHTRKRAAARASSSKAKRTKQDQRLAVGGSKVATEGRIFSREGGEECRLINRKRTAESVGERTEQDNEQKQLPRARKKRKRKKESE